MFAVRRTHGFLQNGTSARLAAPLIRMPASEHALPRDSRVRINGTLQMPGGKKSSPRPLPRLGGGIRTGWSKKPFEPRQQAIAEGHRVR